MNKNVKNVLSATLCLFIICLVATFAVAGTRYVFADKIAEQEWQETQNVMRQLIEGDSYEEIVNNDEEQIYQALDSSGESLGYLFVTAAYGYGSDVSVMTAINEGTVLGVQVLDSSQETPGLGQNVSTESFASQFTGMSAAPIVVKTAPAGDNQIQAVTGATKSSTAVANAVALAQEQYADVAE